MKLPLLLLGSTLALSAVGQPAQTPTVNPGRIEQRLTELAQTTKGPDGSNARVAYTPADIRGRTYFIDLMKKAGLAVSVDYAGNIIGTRPGKNAAKKAIAFGSHIDMVPAGGNYDGCVGSVAAVEIIDVLNENKLTTEHPLEVIIFSNEEGGTVGSSALAGHLDANGLKSVSQSGLTIGEGTRAIGGNPDRIAEVRRKKGDLAAFLELHIEQGGILEAEKINIGVVEGIVGIRHWEVTVSGFANHAGTTPMSGRQDALLAAARFIIAVNEVVTSVEGRQVGTVGKIAVQPGAYNVIPGKVVLGLEIRDLSDPKIGQLFGAIERRAADIARASGTTISFQPQFNPAQPALATKAIQDKIVGATKGLGLSYKFMQSGAGHDAQEMAELAPMGMIFIPSIGGISHSPKEFSKTADIANGANVLLQTILALDKE